MPLSNTPLGQAKIDLVIFDCDGVLIDSEFLSKRVLLSMLSNLGIEASSDYFDRYFLGRSYEAMTAQIYQDYQITLPSTFRQDYHHELMLVFTQELVPTTQLSWMLNQLQVPYCVATSSSPERTRFALSTTKLYSYFQGQIFTASEVQNGKPAPDLFLHAAKQMGIDPAKCLVIEDSQAGIEAGVAANMHVIKFAGASHLIDLPVSSSAIIDETHIIKEWSQLYQLLPALRTTN